MTQVRFNLDEYSIRVLDVVKGKHGLKNREAALRHFIKNYGQEYVEHEIRDDVVKHFNNIVREHKSEYGKTSQKMTLEELDDLLGLDENQ